jgi:hypothetical protein
LTPSSSVRSVRTPILQQDAHRSHSQSHSHAHDAQILGDLPMRGATFATPDQILQYMPTQHHQQQQQQQQNQRFNDNSISPHSQGGIGSPVPLEMVPNADRRGPNYTDFAPAPHGPIYQSPWSSAPTTASQASHYAYANPQVPAEAQYVHENLPLAPLNQAGYVPHTFEGLPRPSYDTSVPLYRQPDLSSASGHSGQAYDYAPNDGRLSRTSPSDLEELPRQDV